MKHSDKNKKNIKWYDFHFYETLSKRMHSIAIQQAISVQSQFLYNYLVMLREELNTKTFRVQNETYKHLHR